MEVGGFCASHEPVKKFLLLLLKYSSRMSHEYVFHVDSFCGDC